MAVTVSDTSQGISRYIYEEFSLEEFCRNRINHKNFKDKYVDKVPDDISYEDFFKLYLVPNKPCVLTPKKKPNIFSWEITKWVTEEGTPNWSGIAEKYGSSIVPVADCAVKEYNSQRKEYVLLAQYIRYCEKLVKENYDYENMPCLYLKDWHLTRCHPDFNAYQTPEFFESDWLNSFYITKMDLEDDYRFVYIGPKGTWTPFHSDVFGSFSWSANLCGKKRWLLFPPGAEKFFLDINGKLAFDIESTDVKDVSKYPNAGEYFEQFGQGIEVIQEAGEIIFVPSGWHHQVWNLEDTISVNHNWFNGCNIDLIFKNMSFALKEVTDELDDCKTDENWFNTCQLVLHAHHGMNYGEFILLLDFVVREAKNAFTRHKNISYQSLFDVKCVSHVTNLLRQQSEILEELDLLSSLNELDRYCQIFLDKNSLK